MDAQFEWDPAKEAKNLAKHHASFAVAKLAVSDPLALVEHDRVEGGEDRWISIGMADGILLLVVAHAMRVDGDIDIIRIISARRAEPKGTEAV